MLTWTNITVEVCFVRAGTVRNFKGVVAIEIESEDVWMSMGVCEGTKKR